MITTTKLKFFAFLLFITALGALSFPNKEDMGAYYFNSYRYDEAVEKIEDKKGNKSLSSLHILKDYYLNDGEVQNAIEIQNQIVKKVPKNSVQIKEIIKLYEWENMNEEALKWKTHYASLLKGKEQQDLLIEILLSYQADRNFKHSDDIATRLKSFKTKEAYQCLVNYYSSTNNLAELISITSELKSMGKHTENFNEFTIAGVYNETGDYEKSTKTYLSMISDSENLYKNEQWLEKLDRELIIKKRNIIDLIIQNYEREKNYPLVILSKLYIYSHIDHDIQIALDALTLSLKTNSKHTDQILNFLKKERLAKNNASIATLLADAKEFNNAIIFYEKALKDDPTNKTYFSELTYLYEVTDQLEKAYRLQKELLKQIEKPKPNTIYIQKNEILIAQNNDEIILQKDEVADTKRKIIELLIRLKKEDELKNALIDYTKSYPLHLDMQKELAAFYVKRSHDEEAARIYQFILSVSPFDQEASLYVIDRHTDAKEFAEAIKLLKAQKEYLPRHEYLKRAIAIYYETNDSELSSLCREAPLETESQVQCLIYNKSYKEAVELLRKQSSTADKITLTYLLLEMKKTSEAGIELQKLEKSSSVKPLDLIRLKDYYNEVTQEKEFQTSNSISSQIVIFNSPGYSFSSGDALITTRIKGPWSTGLQLYEQRSNGKIKNNIAPMIGLKEEDNIFQYRYGIIQNSHELLGQFNFRQDSSLTANISTGTPFTDLYVLSFNNEIKRNRLLIDYVYNIKDQQINVYYDYSKYNFADNSYASATRQVLSSQYLYKHRNHLFQGVYVRDIDFSDSEIAGVLFSPLTLLSYKVGYDFRRKNLEVTPSITAGKDIRAKTESGAIYTYEIQAIYRFSYEKNLSLFWEQANYGQQNIGQENTSIFLTFNYWYN